MRGWPFITCVLPEWTGHNGKVIFYLISWSRISCAEPTKSIEQTGPSAKGDGLRSEWMFLLMSPHSVSP